MTDEEKAHKSCYEQIIKKDGKKLILLDELKEAYLNGLTEGRKEKCLEQNNDGTIRPCEVMKENEQLKQQIEKMKNCRNCKHFIGNVPCEEYHGWKCKKPYDHWELSE